jgi:hypothetical protein
MLHILPVSLVAGLPVDVLPGYFPENSDANSEFSWYYDRYD